MKNKIKITLMESILHLQPDLPLKKVIPIYKLNFIKYFYILGCYATMLMRELTKVSSAFDIQMKLNDLYKTLQTEKKTEN